MLQDRVAELALKRFREGIGGEAASFLIESSSQALGLTMGDEPADFSLEELSIAADMLVSGNEDIFEVHWGYGTRHASELVGDLVKLWAVFLPDAVSMLFQRDFNGLAIRQVESGVAEMTSQIMEGRPMAEVMTERYRDVLLEKARLVSGLSDVVADEPLELS